MVCLEERNRRAHLYQRRTSTQVIGIVKAARYLCKSAHGALERDLSDEGSVTWPQGGESMFPALQAQSQEVPMVPGKDVTVLAAAL